MLENFKKKTLGPFLVSFFSIALPIVSCNSKKESLDTVIFKEEAIFAAEKEGRYAEYPFIQATIYPGPLGNNVLEIFASGDTIGMIRLRVDFKGIGSYTLGGMDNINQAILLDEQDNITSQKGSLFLHSFGNGKISGVFNFTGQSPFHIRTITVNKGKFSSVPLQR